MTVRPVLLAAVAGLLVAPAAAGAGPAQKIKPCPTVGKTLAVEKDSKGKADVRVWSRKGVVSGCSTYYPSYGRVTKLGRFKPRLVRVDGTEVIWTVRTAGTDRVSEAELYSGRRRVRSRRAVPRKADGGAPAASTIDAVRVDANGVFAWIAGTGDLVVGGESLDRAPVVTPAGGLPQTTAFQDGNVAVVDTIPEQTTSRRRAVVAGMTVDIGEGDGDECGYGNPVTWRWTTPLGAASATAGVFSTNPADFCH